MTIGQSFLKEVDDEFKRDFDKDALRNTINHFVHHRGQMTVYLRLLDVPIPQLYGPTAAER